MFLLSTGPDEVGAQPEFGFAAESGRDGLPMLHQIEQLGQRRAMRGLHHQVAPFGVIGLQRAAARDGDVFEVVSAQQSGGCAQFRTFEAAIDHGVLFTIRREADHGAAIDKKRQVADQLDGAAKHSGRPAQTPYRRRLWPRLESRRETRAWMSPNHRVWRHNPGH